MSRALLSHGLFGNPSLAVPTAAMLELPERAVQFGTGAFLRGFVDDFIDAANHQGLFNGRVVAVGSTGSGRDRAFSEQHGLYTLVSRGIINGTPTESRGVISSVSRALSAADEWDAVLACAHNPQLSVIFSNTTEVGIALDESDRLDMAPPHSFPAKLTRFLYERARAFAFAPSAGVVMIPCELIQRNGDQLRRIVNILAERWDLEPAFVQWLDAAVPFCNTLVDRIVPGAPSAADGAALRDTLGYHDNLLTTAEYFRQFVIEGDDALAQRLAFTGADPGIVITADVEPYRQRKVSLLNGGHTISVGVALLSGCHTVQDAMVHPRVGPFMRRAILEDIAPMLDVPAGDAFAHNVLERFANPFIRHTLFDITLHGTTKMQVRVVPTMMRAAQRLGGVPATMVFGFAAHLLFLRGDLQAQRAAEGHAVPPDVRGEQITALWHSAGIVSDGSRADIAAIRHLVQRVASDDTLWGVNLGTIPMFVDAVSRQLTYIITEGVDTALDHMLATGIS